MEDAATGTMATDRNTEIANTVDREQSRLRNFIRRRVADPSDVEDVLQEVFYELVEANRLLMPIEHISGWLFAVARNRITDLFRKKVPDRLEDAMAVGAADADDRLRLEDLLPSGADGPDVLYARHAMMQAFEAALDELPDDQRLVFVAHEIEGRSFKELADETGANINTLLSRKRYAVLHLRNRLKADYDDFKKG